MFLCRSNCCLSTSSNCFSIHNDPYIRCNRIGNSDKSWQDAAQVALEEAKKTVHGITTVEITDMTAKVDANTGNIIEYHTGIKVAFGIEH